MPRRFEIRIDDDANTGLEVSKKHRDYITWEAPKDKPATIKFIDKTPLENDEMEFTIKANKHTTRRLAKGVVKGDYPYEVQVGEQTADPTIVVDD